MKVTKIELYNALIHNKLKKKATHKEKLRNRRCKLCKKPVKHEGASSLCHYCWL